jgi:hypothetical protein
VAELRGVSHLEIAIDRVKVAPTCALPRDEASLNEVGEDPLRCTLGDPDLVGDVPEPHLWVAGDAKQNLGVVGDESPATGGLLT